MFFASAVSAFSNYKMLNIFMSLILLASTLPFGSFVVNIQALPNGCKLIKKTNSTNSKNWKTTPLSFLNCAAAGWSTLNLGEAKLGDVRTVSISHNQLTTIGVDNLKAFENLTRLDLSSNQLKSFSGSNSKVVFSSATYLSLEHNQLTSVPVEALKSFPSIKTLLLYSNSISNIRNSDFRYTTKLTRLLLGPNPIKKLQNGWLTSLSLTNIVLRGCNLDEIPPQLAQMDSLERVILSGNEIKSVPANSFAKCESLKNVDLGSNKIRSIEARAFAGAGNLNLIDLSDNKISDLPQGAFTGISRENVQINLYENRLNCSCSLAWLKTWTNHLESGDISTEVLYTCWNPSRLHGKKSRRLSIDDFRCQANDTVWKDCNNPKPKRPIVVNKKLQKCGQSCYCSDETGKMYHNMTEKAKTPYDDIMLEFSRNKNNNPGLYCAYDLGPAVTIRPDIRAISVSGNKNQTFDLSIFGKYKQLQTLVFTNGEAAVLKASSLPSLQALNLGHNKISKIGKDIFRKLPNLENLILSHNSIEDFPDDMFDQNEKISSLHLGSNPVKDFKGNFLRELPLEKLSLQDLSIETVPHAIKVMDKLSFLDLRNNAITRIEEGMISKCENLKTLFLDNNQIVHIDTNAFNGATSLRVINLSGNQLKSLHLSVFSNLDEGRLYVNLLDNPIECNCKLQGFKNWLEIKESQNPSTNIEFQCWQPLRLHQKKSFEIKASRDLKCDANEKRFEVQDSCVGSGRIALAVCLTMFFTLLATAVAWRCTRRKQNSELRYFAKF